MRADPDGFMLSTGKSIYANHRLVSIPILEKDGDDPLSFGEGYDGGFDVDPNNQADRWQELTIAEGIEVCDAMLAAWKKRRSKLKEMSKQ